MHLTDIDGNKITITDLKASIEQATLFKGFRHVNANPLLPQIRNGKSTGLIYWKNYCSYNKKTFKHTKISKS